MNWRYASIVLVCLIPFAYASEEAAEGASDHSEQEAVVDKTCVPTGNSLHDVACEDVKYKAAEARLNASYKQLLNKLDKITEEYPHRSGLKPKLISAQRAWIKYRKSQCRAVEEWYKGGTLQYGLYADCMRSLAEKRTEELNSFTGYQT